MNCCKKCGSSSVKIGVSNTQSGSTIYPYFCSDCGYVSGGNCASKSAAMQYAATHGPLKYVKTRTQQWMEKNQIEEKKCEVCSAHGVEEHHWAPKHLFGDDAERWPKSYLCRSCHAKWHAVVTPLMSKK